MSDNLLSPVPCGFLPLEEWGKNINKKAECAIYKKEIMFVEKIKTDAAQQPNMFSDFPINNMHVCQ